MYSALAGAFVFTSIAILIAHAMEGFWIGGLRTPLVKDRTPLAPDQE